MCHKPPLENISTFTFVVFWKLQLAVYIGIKVKKKTKNEKKWKNKNHTSPANTGGESSRPIIVQ